MRRISVKNFEKTLSYKNRNQNEFVWIDETCSISGLMVPSKRKRTYLPAFSLVLTWWDQRFNFMNPSSKFRNRFVYLVSVRIYLTERLVLIPSRQFSRDTEKRGFARGASMFPNPNTSVVEISVSSVLLGFSTKMYECTLRAHYSQNHTIWR